jgi:4-nitrophenyl phosphatase
VAGTARIGTVVTAFAAGAPVLCDLDGVVWLARQPIEGSVEAIARLRRAGHRVLFVTNNSAALISEHEAALAAIGVPAEGDVLSSAAAAALLVEPGETVMLCAGPGVEQAVLARGAVLARDGARCDAVVVGFHRSFDYDEMDRAAAAVRGGARFIATNDDATFPTPTGLIPGAGAIVAGISVASGRQPVIAGKPYAPMAGLVRTVTGLADVSDAIVIGDRPDTDGRLAAVLGCRYGHVWSGVTPPGVPVVPAPWIEGANLAALVAQLLG